MEMIGNAGLLAKATLAIGFLPLVMAGIYLVRPTEHHLSLMRPVSLAGLFAALAGSVVGALTILRGIGATAQFSTATWGRIAMGAAEALVPTFVGFACLAVAWLLVAVGMNRGRPDMS